MLKYFLEHFKFSFIFRFENVLRVSNIPKILYSPRNKMDSFLALGNLPAIKIKVIWIDDALESHISTKILLSRFS